MIANTPQGHPMRPLRLVFSYLSLWNFRLVLLLSFITNPLINFRFISSILSYDQLQTDSRISAYSLKRLNNPHFQD